MTTMMKARMKYLALMPVLACLLGPMGCERRPLDYVVKDVSSGIPVLIGGTGMEPETKSAKLDSTTFSDFVLYAGWARNGHFDETTAANDYMNGTQVTKDWATGVWNTRVKYYWPARNNGSISFFALAPYINDTTVLKLSPAYRSGEPLFLYTPSTIAAEYQKDLCIAGALYDKTVADNPLSFHFSHALTNVEFWANFTTSDSTSTQKDSLPPGMHLKVNRLTLHNIVGTKGLTWKREAPGFGWTPDTEDALADYSLSLLSGELKDGQLPPRSDSTYLHLEEDKGILLLLPQDINEAGQSIKSTLEIDFSIYRQDGSTPTQLSSFNAVVNLPSGTSGEWKPASVVRYRFTLNVANLSEVEISASSSGWIDNWKDGNTAPDITIEK